MAKSRYILREVGATEKLWLQVIKLHALYGKELLSYAREWIQKLESSTQDRMLDSKS